MRIGNGSRIRIVLRIERTNIFCVLIDLLEPRDLTIDEHLFFNVMGNNQRPPKIVNNYGEFLHNLIRRFEYDVWGSDVDWNLFIVAGGAVISSLFVEYPNGSQSDIDLFFLHEDMQTFERAVV